MRLTFIGAAQEVTGSCFLVEADGQEGEWARAQRKRSRQPPADVPPLLYTVAQAEACLGQPARPIVCDPTPIDSADVLVVESTYGNRLHRPLGEAIDELVSVIDDTLRRRQGNIIIPAFALGRTQELLHLLLDLCRQGKLPRLQVCFGWSAEAPAPGTRVDL